MKSDVLFIANADSSTFRLVEKAVARTERGLQHAAGSRDAFEILNGGLSRVDAIVIDLDPGTHSLSVLEAMSCCRGTPPVIVITSLEEMDMAPVAYRHGAAACISKPFNEEEFSHLINRVCPAQGAAPSRSSDLWGHPKRSVHVNEPV